MPRSLHLYLAATTASLTASLFGYSVGFIGGVLVLPSFQRSFHLDDLSPIELASAQSQIVTVWLIGALFGVPLGMPMCSRLGRKQCLILTAALNVLGALTQLMAGGSLYIFSVGRLLNGLGVGAGTLVSPIYISEISPPSKRGMLMSGYGAFLLLSALIGSWSAFISNSLFLPTSTAQWQLPIAVQLFPGTLLLLGILAIPETPRYLAGRDDFQGAEKALVWLRQLPANSLEISQEVSELSEEVEANKKYTLHQMSFLREISSHSMRKRLSVGIGLMIAQNMVGLNALNYYGPVIFMSAGFTSVSSSLLLTGIFGLVKLIAAIAVMFIFVRIRGNRFWLKTGATVCGVSMLVLAYCVRQIIVSDETHEAKVTIGGVVSVLMVYIFAFSFSVSFGPISWNVCSEIFPSHINDKCCAITTCTQWLFQILIASITPRLIASVGWATYAIYATFCAISYVWVSLYVPETRDVPLGKPMDELFGADAKDSAADDAAIEEDGEISEITALLQKNQRRRSSIALPV